jgi:L-Ala-D/L-Glu epimerase
MKIRDVRARVLRIPRLSTLTTSYGSDSDAVTVLVELECDDGLVGYGQVGIDHPAYGETAVGVVANVVRHLGPALVGHDPRDVTRCEQRLHKALPHHEFSVSAVEMALWDAAGKALGAPVWRLLGGRVREGVDLMGFVDHDTPERMAEGAGRTLDATPFGVLKMKIGMDPAADLARVRAVAEAVRGRAVLQVDGNTGYDVAQAIPTLTAMEATGVLGAIEQPVARLADMAELARRLATPIMADESIYAPSDAIDVVRQRAASIALMKIAKHGGIGPVRRIGAVFEAAGLQLSVALYYDLIAAAACHLAVALPAVCWPSPETDMADTILQTPLRSDGLLLRAPEGPGLGVALDWDKVERYTVPA